MRQLTDNFLNLQVKTGPFVDQDKVLEIQVNPQGEANCEFFCRGFPAGLVAGTANIRVENKNIIFENTQTQEMMKFPLDYTELDIVSKVMSKLWKEYEDRANMGGFGRASLILSFQKGNAFSRFGKRADIKRLRSRNYAKCTPPKSKK